MAKEEAVSIEMAQLQGLSYDKAHLFGLPHLGCEYTSYDTGKYRITTDHCVICGRWFPLNAHHVVPRSVRKEFHIGDHMVRSPLACLCGSGTQGCHGMFHGGARFSLSWEWYEEEYEDMWWSGELLDRFGPHSPELFGLGRYVVHDRKLGRDWPITSPCPRT